MERSFSLNLRAIIDGDAERRKQKGNAFKVMSEGKTESACD